MNDTEDKTEWDETDHLVDQILSEIDEDERIWSETVQVGDFVDGSRDRTYTFSKHQYETKGKLYEVREKDMRKDENGKFYSRTVIVDGDWQDPTRAEPERHWLGMSKVIYRNGELIWESTLIKAARASLEGCDKLTQEQRKELEEMLFKGENK